MLITEYMKNNTVILDGGLGTLLQKAGLKPGERPESWNLTHPEKICEIHKAYYDSGSNIVSTNTFGANLLNFSGSELEEIIKAAVENVRQAKTASKGNQEKYIALDIGPCGKMLKPYGDFDFEEAVSLFSKTAALGEKYGADLIFIETMNDSYETKAALLGVKESTNLPVFVSNAYSENGKLMTGASPSAMTAMLEGLGADAIGANCSLGPKNLLGVISEILSKASVPVILKPNAGLPQSVNGKTVYNVLPDEFSDDIVKAVEMGVRLVGGCCGTTPEYIRLVNEKVRDIKPVEIKKKNITCVSSYTHSVEFNEKPVLIGERINPTGKKRFKQALRENDIGYILREGIAQKEKGADILDVNVGLPEIDECEMMAQAVSEIQAVIDLPLQIDTSNFEAMERAMRLYNGKPMINSVSGKKEVMSKVFPLVKKYGGLLVALTLDDNGIPETAEGRVKIAENILLEAAKYGIDKKDIIFDPLAMAVSADPKAAQTTLEAVRRISSVLGCKTVLGVSNISFGLPMRGTINAAFFTLALGNGLSAAIMNPYSDEMMKAFFAFSALKGIDKGFTDYINFAAGVSDSDKVILPVTQESSLRAAVIKGLKSEAASAAEKLLTERKPLEIVQEEIIPALDEVGKGYEEKRLYLPSLLMSAEAAQAAFEKIKAAVSGEKSGETGGYEIILATVHGDIHDIGKNIVKLLLENYGFKIIDLGKDVPKERIVEQAVKRKIKLVGLSALMTTTVPAMEETIKALREAAPECKVIVGGAVLNREYADMIGADAYAKDAMETVRYAMSL